MNKKFLILGLILSLIVGFFLFDLQQFFSLEYIKSQQSAFQQFYAENTLLTLLIFFVCYVAIAALSLPGAAIMTILAGTLFGLVVGTIMVSLASTLGATLAFLATRYLLRDTMESRYPDKIKIVNEGIKKEGAFYLFALRLVPLFPFFLINIVMGLTKLPVLTFALVSQIGMLLGTIAYVFAGTQLASIDSLSGILSPGIIFAFAVLGLFPLVARKIMDTLRANKVYAKYDKPKKFDNNLIVIGAGAGGLVSSYIAAAVKAKVTLIEKHKMGGDCLNTGCVPSKAIIRTAKLLSEAQHAPQYGIDKMEAEVDFKSVMKRVHEVIRKIEPHDSVERYTGLGVNVIQGEAKILDPFRVEVNGEVLTTRNIIVSTGARPFVPPIPGLDKVNYLTSDTLWELDELPKKFIVLGGGPIGSELTQAFARLGSQVTLVEREERILIREDSDVSELVLENFNEDKVQVLTQHDAVEVIQRDGQDILVCKHNDKKVELPFDKLLIAIGRKANVTGFGLEQLGVETNPNGTITANDFLETNYPNIHVVGDVTGPYQFTHTAAHMAWFASVNALFGFAKRFRVDYRVIPWATFTDPEVSRVGLNETEAKEQGIPYEVTSYGLDDLDRAIADSAEQGFVKVLTQPGKDTILGATIVGKDSSSLIAEFVLAMKYKLGLNKILGTIHIYPTMSEANKYVAGNWKRKNAPEKLLVWVEKFHTWRRG